MSHVEQISGIRIHDLDVLACVLDRMGLELRRDQLKYAWWGYLVDPNMVLPPGVTPENVGQCKHAIRIKGTTPKMGSGGPWEIALVDHPEGGFQLMCDWYGSGGAGLAAAVGEGGNKLAQEYNAQVVLRELYREGFSITSTTDEDGVRHLTAIMQE